MATFGQKLRELRREHGLSQDDLAQRLNLTHGAISLYELGKRNPDLDALNLLCDFFDVTSDFILGRVSALSVSTQDDDEREVLLRYRTSDDMRKELVRVALGIGRKESGGQGVVTSAS